MEKKQYICPLVEVMQLGADVVMKDLGPGSLPDQPGSGAPKRRTKVF